MILSGVASPMADSTCLHCRPCCRIQQAIALEQCTASPSCCKSLVDGNSTFVICSEIAGCRKGSRGEPSWELAQSVAHCPWLRRGTYRQPMRLPGAGGGSTHEPGTPWKNWAMRSNTSRTSSSLMPRCFPSATRSWKPCNCLWRSTARYISSALKCPALASGGARSGSSSVIIVLTGESFHSTAGYLLPDGQHRQQQQPQQAHGVPEPCGCVDGNLTILHALEPAQ